MSGRSLVLLFARCGSPPASAAVVDGTVTTLVAGQKDPRDGKLYTVVPIYQSLQLSLSDLQLKAHFTLYQG